jgi:ABC-type nitrate/sulfonate/bicarbonate transport system substrate-binding protein
MLWSRRALLRNGMVVGGGLLVVACAPAASTPSATAAPKQVKAAWVAKTANQMLWPLAKDAGYFDKYGISFDLNYLNGSTLAVPALFARDIDVASVAGSAVVGAQAAGQDLVMVAGFLNQAVFRVMAMATGLQSIDDVKGKNIAVTRVGNADYYAWQVVLQRQGWADTDVTFINANDVQGQVALLQKGDVQAIAVSPPNDVLASNVGAKMIFDIASLNEPEQNVGVAVTRAFLGENRAVVKSVLQASIEAMARWKKDAAFTKSVIQKYLESSDQAFTDVGYSAYAPLWPKAPYPSRDGLARVIDEVSAQNSKARDLKVDALIDNSVVKELEDSGFIASIYGA